MKKLLITLLLGIFLLSLIHQVDGYFYRDHESFVLKGFQDVNSPLADECRPYIEQVLNGVEAADVGVLHYFDDKVTSYIGAHQRLGYNNCLREAGSDVESKCFCHGIALHIEMDSLSHLDGGIVVEKIRGSLGSNFLGHMVVERSFEQGHQAFLEERNDPIISSGDLDFYDKRVLNLMFEETGGDSKYMKLINEASGINMETDARVIRSGYLGEGFFSTVYQDKISLPFWAWGIGIGVALIGLVIAGVLLFVGKTRWKLMGVFLWIGVSLIGILIIVSFITGTTWKVTTSLIEVPALVGYLAVSPMEVESYHNELTLKTNNFLETEQLTTDDASGLSYVDQNGVFHEGALKRAESGFKFILLPILLISLAVMSLWIFMKSFRMRTPKILDVFGWALFGVWTIFLGVLLVSITVGLFG